jgi:hypothetical protein
MTSGEVIRRPQLATTRRLLRAAAALTSATIAATVIGTAQASARPSWFAVSQQGECLANHDIDRFLRRHHANVLRLILAPQDAPAGAGIGCLRSAHAAGFKVYISLQFNNRWGPGQVAAYFRRVLPSYAPYLWAIGVGNEQDLTSTSRYGQGTRALGGRRQAAGARYRAVWDAVEPVLVRLAPHAIRVYGEFSPWSFSANKQGFVAGRPPGVQAIAAHCYHTKVGGLADIPREAAWAASKGLPLWCSEMGPALATRTKPHWIVPDTWASWNAAMARIAASSPDLKMVGYYYDPAL